VAGIRAL